MNPLLNHRQLALSPAPGHTSHLRPAAAPLPGWRHEPCPSGIGIGVLAPHDAFAATYPTFTGETDDILDDATHHLDTGAPASALLGLTAAYHETPERLPDLHPTWARAYDALDRPLLRARLDTLRNQTR